MTFDDKKKTGGQAFPRAGKYDPDYGASEGGIDGMTLRDWFAGQALSGLVQNLGSEQASRMAYGYADTMLRAREQ